MPGGRDVGANIRELKASKTKRPQRQIVAIALNQAREAGANIPQKKTGRGEDVPRAGESKVTRTPPAKVGVGRDVPRAHESGVTRAPVAKVGVGAEAHPGFAAVEKKIGQQPGITNPGAVLAAGARKASPSAVKKNPRLKRVSGVGKK